MDAIARDAGREIYAIYRAGFDVVTKSDGSPVTIADQRAEEIILAGLRAAAPGVPILAEEEVAAGIETDCGRRFFLVDPLDGTRGFTEGGAEFTVNIALVEDGAPVLGVVYAPATGVLYLGGPDGASALVLRFDAPWGPAARVVAATLVLEPGGGAPPPSAPVLLDASAVVEPWSVRPTALLPRLGPAVARARAGLPGRAIRLDVTALVAAPPRAVRGVAVTAASRDASGLELSTLAGPWLEVFTR
jgi:hypothetical protein